MSFKGCHFAPSCPNVLPSGVSLHYFPAREIPNQPYFTYDEVLYKEVDCLTVDLQGGEYEFRVKAVNAAGPSRPSATAGPLVIKDQTCE